VFVGNIDGALNLFSVSLPLRVREAVFPKVAIVVLLVASLERGVVSSNVLGII